MSTIALPSRETRSARFTAAKIGRAISAIPVLFPTFDTVIKFTASLGGTLSRGMAINEQGLVAGWSNQSDGSRRAVVWRNGSIEALGTLGGPSSTVPWPGLNDAGLVVGISQTDEVDPLDEAWSCEFGGFLLETTNLICRGFVRTATGMQELPPFRGGNHTFATDVNNGGQIVGSSGRTDPSFEGRSRTWP